MQCWKDKTCSDVWITSGVLECVYLMRMRTITTIFQVKYLQIESHEKYNRQTFISFKFVWTEYLSLWQYWFLWDWRMVGKYEFHKSTFSIWDLNINYSYHTLETNRFFLNIASYTWLIKCLKVSSSVWTDSILYSEFSP